MMLKLRKPIALGEDSDSVPGTHLVATKLPAPPVPEVLTPSPGHSRDSHACGLCFPSSRGPNILSWPQQGFTCTWPPLSQH